MAEARLSKPGQSLQDHGPPIKDPSKKEPDMGDLGSLETLDLSRTGIDDSGCKFLAASLAKNTSLTRLSLKGNKIGPEGVKILCKALKGNQILKELDLSENQLGDEGILHVARLLQRNRSLTKVNFDEVQGSLISRAPLEPNKRPSDNSNLEYPLLKRPKVEEGVQPDLSPSNTLLRLLSLEKVVEHLLAQQTLFFDDMRSKWSYASEKIETRHPMTSELNSLIFFHLLTDEKMRVKLLLTMAQILSSQSISNEIATLLTSKKTFQILGSYLTMKDPKLQEATIAFFAALSPKISFADPQFRSFLESFMAARSASPLHASFLIRKTVSNNLFIKLSLRQRLDEYDLVCENPFFAPEFSPEGPLDGVFVTRKDQKLHEFIDFSKMMLEGITDFGERVRALTRLVIQRVGTPKALRQERLKHLALLKHSKKIFLGDVVLGGSFHCSLLMKILAEIHHLPCILIQWKTKQGAVTLNLFLNYLGEPGTTATGGTELWDIFWEDEVNNEEILHFRGTIGVQPTDGQVSTTPEGTNTFGKYLIFRTEVGLVGIKRLHIPSSHRTRALNAAAILSLFKHENLSGFRKICLLTSRDKHLLQLECDHHDVSLADLISKTRQPKAPSLYLSLINIKFFIYQIGIAMEFLHGTPFPTSHPNVPRTFNLNWKPSNILANPSPTANFHNFRLSEYGLRDILSPSHFHATLLEKPGNHPYLAPELRDLKRALEADFEQLKKADVYGFGVVLGEAITCQPPKESGQPYLSGDVRAEVPVWIRDILFSCLEEPKKEAQLWGDCKDSFAEILE